MAILSLLLLAALISQSNGDTCSGCFTTYTNAKGSAACTVAYDYITCIETATGAGCPPTSGNYADLESYMNTNTCSMTTLCTCQREHIRRISSSSTLCTSYKEKLACIAGDLTSSCDGSNFGYSLATDTAALITGLGAACTLTNLCTCEKDYAVTDISVTANRCTAKKEFIGCMRGKTDAACAQSETLISLAGGVEGTISTDCSAFASSVCACELTYVKTDISTDTGCTARKTLVTCLGGVDGAGCASGTTASSIATAVVNEISSLSPSCDTTGTCNCEGEYAKHDISTTSNKCDAQKKLVACLVDKIDVGCTVETPMSLGTSIESHLISCTDFTTTSCSCLLTYIKSDISTDVKKCTAKKTLITCLLGKGPGCLSGTTAKSIATTVVDTELSGISCDVSEATCACETTYAKAAISTDAEHCPALGNFVDCLKKKTATGCSGTAVTALGTIAFTNYATLTAECPLSQTTCGCEVGYIQMSYVLDDDKCTAEKTLVSCLKGKTGSSCKGDATLIDLATTAGNSFGTITGCTALVTDTCSACELVYAKADISSNALKCSALATYLECLKTMTDPGCVVTDTVAVLAGSAETSMKAITPRTDCPVTATCQCDIDFIKADRSSPGARCMAAKTLISCVKGQTDLSCDGSTKASAVATAAETIINTDCTSTPPTDTCICEIAFAKEDLTASAPAPCNAKKDYMDCLSMAYDLGCDGTSKRHSLAVDISACSPSDTCDCQTAYAQVDNTDATAQCSAIMDHLVCLDSATSTGCKTATTIMSMASHLESQVPSTSGCAALSESCQCQTTHLKATRDTDENKCTALKAKLSCLMLARDNGCDGTTSRDAIVTAIKTPTFTCAFSSVCSDCMIPYGDDPYGDATAHCVSIKTLMNCLSGKNVATDTGCDDSKTIKTLVTEFETIGSCSFSDTCTCQLSYMKNSGTDPATKCTALRDYMHCVDGVSDTNCDGSKRRDEVATTIDTAIVNDGALSATCETDLTTTCSSCQIVYAMKDPTTAATHCTNLYIKLGCLAGEKTSACKTSVAAHTVAAAAKTTAGGIGSCTVTSDTCGCEVALAITDIAIEADHCNAMYDELSCLKGKTNPGCDSTSVEDLDIKAKKVLPDITSCAMTPTCSCEVDFAKSDISTEAKRCTASFTELGCLNGKTSLGCDRSSTKDEIDMSIKQWMDGATKAGGATDDKCTTNPVCLCEIAYAVAAQGTNGEKCTALKNFIVCLSGQTAVGCDGASTVTELATSAHTDITNLGADCPVSEACLCEIAFVKADISDNTKECTQLLTKMECLYKTEDTGCVSTTRDTLATDVAARMLANPPNCAAATSSACTCMIDYAKVDPANSAAKCTGLKHLLDCLDGLDPLTVTSCDGSQTVEQLATGADGIWAAMGSANCADKTDTCTCTVDFLKATTGDLCTAYLTKMDCLVASEGANCKDVDRQTYAGTTETRLNAACAASSPGSGTVCKDCEIPYAKVAPTCTDLLIYYSCLYSRRSGSSCNSKTVKDLVTEQDTNFANLGCPALDDTCQCQMDYLKSTSAQCQKSQVIMNCLWEATAKACDEASERSVIATSADTDIDTTCRNSLSDVCKCQIPYAKVDPTDAPAHCTALKTQFMCLEGKSGTGCENTRTLQAVALGGNAKMSVDCVRTDACDCQIAYLTADISTSPKDCTETQKKVACLYATTTTGCDDSTARTALMTNTDTIANTCGYTSSCGCQRTYGKATGGNECGYQSEVITCLQDTVDTGCTGESAFTKTRTELATNVESSLTSGSCASKTDTCQCQIDYAKATVVPTSPDKCKALGELILCLAGKTNTGCDTTSKASDLAAAAHTKMQTDLCPISQTCACQITYAKLDHSTGSKCPGLLNEIECVYGTEDKGCDTTSKRSEVAAAIVADLTSEACTASATDTCKTCVYDYAQVDVENAVLKCSKLGELLHCLDGKTTTSCKSPTPATVIDLATNAKAAIDALGAGCSVVTDTCMCQYTFMKTPVGDDTAQCNAQAQRMECLVASTGMACDGTTTRSAYAATAHTALDGVSGCSAGLSATCTACEIVYAKATSDSDINRCSALKTYFHCLDSQTTNSCFGSKTITTLASEANTRAASDSCSLGDTCKCQANYLMSTETKCIALKNKMSCLAVSFDPACDSSITRDTVATTTDSSINSESCTGVTAVCTCERTYAKTAFPDETTHCSNLKTAVNCLEGETAAGCGATTTLSSFSTAVLTKINALSACTLSDTCTCQVTYLSDDISTTALKCTALEKKEACLYLATSTACDGSTTRKDTIISVDGDIGTAICSIPNTCRCQINYGKAAITPDTAKCTAMKTMIQCLQDTSDDGCRGTTTQTRTQLATSVESFAGTSGDCTLSDACVCQTNYAKADVTGANYCIEQKTLALCLGTTITMGCTGTASHTLASTAVGVINGIATCPPASGTTCKCELDYAVADRSTLALACTATKALIKCLELSTGVGCTSDSKDTIAGKAETYMNDGSKSCAKTATCGCQIELAKTNIDVAANKCSALKTKLVCMRATNDVACGGETKVVEATNTETTLNSMGDATCHVEDSCRCEITHAKTDTSSDTCTPAKTLVHCLTTTTEDGCTSNKLAVGNGAKSVIDSHASCPLTASCTCQATVVTTSTTTDTTRCTAYKTLAMCLGGDNDVGCDGAATKISLATTAESIVKGIGTCNAALTTTCQCEINYAKSDTSTNSLKCSAYNKELTCLFSSTGSSCLNPAQGRHQVATAVDTAVQDAALSCPAHTDECTCTTTYAKTDITVNADKCTAAKALLSCLSGKTGTGCDGVQTAVNIVRTAETAIQDVVTAGDACSLTDSCQCEVTFSKADSSSSTYCESAIAYFGCLYTASDVGCSGTSNADLQTAAKNKIATISGCQLPDTCQCQETYRVNFASNTSQQCKFVKNALGCLSTSSEKSCDRSKNHVEVTTEFETLQTTITSVSCFLTETCKCQVTYGKADITTSVKKCIAAQAYNTCLGKIPNDQDVGCDDITQKRHLTQGPVKAVLAACRGCSLSKLSLMTSLVLVLVAMMVKH